MAALAAHGEALAAELRALDEMPQVKLMPASVFDRATPPGSVAQQRGVICRLLCCEKTLDQKCNNSTDASACPTHVEAARMLRAKVTKQHGSAACLARAEQKLAEEGSSSSSLEVQSAFSVMMGAQIARQRAALVHLRGGPLSPRPLLARSVACRARGTQDRKAVHDRGRHVRHRRLPHQNWSLL